MTTAGYIAGKANFLVTTYLMCIETVNLTAEDDVGSSTRTFNPHNEDQSFRYNPFAWRQALQNLELLGAGPWPYVTSSVYFVGVLIYSAGLAAEFMPISHEMEEWTVFVGFVLGSLCFLIGGLAECIENQVFTTPPWNVKKLNAAWAGAVLNTSGAGFFLLGSIFMYPGSDQSYASSFMFLMGSIIFALGAGTMIVMWKDEQFGLTFLAALNNLGGPNGKPLVMVEALEGEHALGNVEEEPTFSVRGAIFIMLYCLAATVSTYNCLTGIVHGFNSKVSTTFVIELGFDAWLPCLFAHLMMILNSAVVRVPKFAPFHQLYIGSRVLAMLMVLCGVGRLVETVLRATDGHLELEAICQACPAGWMPHCTCTAPDTAGTLTIGDFVSKISL
jgi:hypothetical protein